MANMTSQLKSFAFNRLEKPHPVSLTLALEEVLRIQQQALSQVDIRVRIANDVHDVMGEEVRLRQVLGNLISNAIDATKALPTAKITVSAYRKQEYVIVDVSDNGCGIAPEQLDSIFEPFQTTKKMGEGLGLGLAISANNMKDMRGSISANLNADAGMTFRLSLISAQE
jgi:C4-dicarboxylate-specific signal transduction histidine kinase